MASFYLTETIYSLQNVLVALIPVGNISQMTFVKYRRLLQRFSTINLSEHLSIDTACMLNHTSLLSCIYLNTSPIETS